MNSAVSVNCSLPPEQSEVVIAIKSALCRPECSTTASPTPPCRRRTLPNISEAPATVKNLCKVACPPSAGSSSPSTNTHNESSFAFYLTVIETSIKTPCFQVRAEATPNTIKQQQA